MAAKKVNSVANKTTAAFCRGITLGVGVVGALLLLIMGGLGWATIVAVVALIGVSAVAGEWGVRRYSTLLKQAVAQELDTAKVKFDVELTNAGAGVTEGTHAESM